ncbi:MerR family transcriptional regulator [Knoellia sp. S7-12]|uniref:MerR family transcriptional regulator n=1 Tax=Knoellia sp. S7-12 TaxID=3126698 RepID=UPI0033699F9D
MTAERVYQAAARLDVSSRRLLVLLEANAAWHATASSALSPGGAALIAGTTKATVFAESSRHYGRKPSRRQVFWTWQQRSVHDDYYWGDERPVWTNWVGPEEITTAEAAQAYGVSPATIRQWVRRGRLQPTRNQGRTLIFSARDVSRAALTTGDRNRQPGGALRRDDDRRQPAALGISAALMHELVTADVAARAAGVAASTIRVWKHRGHLSAAEHSGRTPLYLLADVVAAARRSPHRPQRRLKPF